MMIMMMIAMKKTHLVKLLIVKMKKKMKNTNHVLMKMRMKKYHQMNNQIMQHKIKINK